VINLSAISPINRFVLVVNSPWRFFHTDWSTEK